MQQTDGKMKMRKKIKKTKFSFCDFNITAQPGQVVIALEKRGFMK